MNCTLQLQLPERQVHASRVRLQDQVWPEFALDEHARVWTPVREEFLHCILPVNRRVGMYRARWGAFRGQLG